MELLKKLLLLNVLAVVVADNLWNCPDHCHCGWVTGNKAANCSYAGLSSIPTITPEIQIVNFTGNTLTEISTYGLRNGGLHNLNKLLLRDCKLTKIDEHGLSGMDLLLDLDLSKNYLKTLRNDTFQELSNIRWILLNDNQLEKLEDGLFSNLPKLTRIDLSNNKIFQIGVSCFVSVPQLSRIYLNNNRLEYLKLDSLSQSTSLRGLGLYDNPWHCDCKQQPLINWVITKNLFATHDDVTCAEPANLHGKSWRDLETNDFACQPDIEGVVSTTETTESNQPHVRKLLEVPDAEITISCQVNGNPLHTFYRSPNWDWEIKYYRCGDYICVSTGESERIVKLSKAPRPPAVGNKE